MKSLFFICGLVLATSVTPMRAHGQTRADTASVLLDAARQLDAEGRRDAARALMELVQRRYAGTQAAASAAALLATYGTAAERSEPGRVELAVWSTTYGLWLGVAVPLILDAESPEAFGIGLLTGAPAGFLAARAYNRKHPGLTVGQARAITFGGTWGTWQGAGWTEVLLDGQTSECTEQGGCSFEDGPTARQLVGAMVAGGVAGIGTGALLARKPISPGVATTVSLSGMWGTWFGFAVGQIADFTDDGMLAAGLIGGDAGVVTGALLAPRWNVSRNRARIVSLAGIIGGVAGGGVDLIVQPDDEAIAVAIPLAGSIVGLIVGARATRDYDITRGGDAGSPGEDPGDALLEWKDGFRVGALTPVPVLRHDPRSARQRLQPAVAVSLFHARF